MAHYHHRNYCSRGGAVLLFFAFLGFLVSFSVPFWSEATNSHEGLWSYRIKILNTSGDYYYNGEYTIVGYPAWFHAVRLLECVCLVGSFAACVVSLISTDCFCRSPAPVVTRTVWVLAAISGALGFVGCMVYIAMRDPNLSGDTQPSENPSGSLAVFISRRDIKFLWGFYLAIISSVLIVIAAVIIGVINLPVTSDGQLSRATSMVTITGSQDLHGYPEGMYGWYDQSYGYIQPPPGFYQPAPNHPRDQRTAREGHRQSQTRSGSQMKVAPGHPRDKRTAQEGYPDSQAELNVEAGHPSDQRMGQEGYPDSQAELHVEAGHPRDQRTAQKGHQEPHSEWWVPPGLTSDQRMT